MNAVSFAILMATGIFIVGLINMELIHKYKVPLRALIKNQSVFVVVIIFLSAAAMDYLNLN